MLTKKQHELLMFIHHYLEDRGVCPSFDEMKEALDLKSKSGIHRLITGLTERGFIRRLPHRARALEVLKLPDAVLPEGLKNRNTKPSTGSPKENVVQAEFGNRSGDNSSADNGIVNLPLYGRIAAGLAIEAVTDPDSFVDVPQSMLDGGKHYCLEVAGDSMINAGIHDGDTVVIRDCNTAENGAIVVALIDNEEVTLKRLHRKGNTVALEAENPEYETRIFGPDRVKVQGKLVGLFRQY
ncbi:transcriptional repressor LexA [Sneathiella sp. P13V-1]|uniref:transcriptional repressor LexA n=1 Tax=Sneathiella sp. P13V-1 TaxID=2697366 RepID=UPI00187B5F16|nr:transcriptional repressor LexA [Sneathiella sp. P13V-1]MBE7637559.1 transcriptional repressor LexA [Sneathiella sp. P13V-1]